MTVTYGFYNSIDDDRLYDATDFGKLFQGIISDGVYANVEHFFSVHASSGMQINVYPGRAWFNNTWTHNDGNEFFTLDGSHDLYDRIDLVYLEVDTINRINKIDVFTGVPATNPVRPSWIPEGGIYHYPIAEILIKRRVSTIYQQDITNLVGIETPFVTGLISVFNAADLVIQWEAEFMTWFDAMKDQLTEDAAGNLQAQIYNIVGDFNPPLIDLVALKTHDHVGEDGGLIGVGGLVDGAVIAGKIATGGVTAGNIASGGVTAGNIATGGVSATAQLANDIVDDTKVGNRVPQFYRRQGGNASDWSIPGTTNYTPGPVRFQAGVVSLALTTDLGGGIYMGEVDVTFPISFSNKPNILLSQFGTYSANVLKYYNPTLNTVKIIGYNNGVTPSFNVVWFAFGPE